MDDLVERWQTMPIEQCDRDARNALIKLIDCMGSDDDCWHIDRALKAHRITAEQRGRDRERAAVVAWLRDEMADWLDLVDAEYLAKQIEAGEHVTAHTPQATPAPYPAPPAIE